MFITFMILQAALFVPWAFCAFRWLFQMRRRGAARTGQMFPGPFTFLAMVGDWWRDPAERRFRLVFTGLTVALIAVTALWALVVVPSLQDAA